VSSHSLKSNSKCCDFCIWCPNSTKLVGEFALSLLVCVVKILDQYKMCWFFVSQSKFKGSIWVHQTALDGCNFRGLYLLHSMFNFNQICSVMLPLQSSYCDKKIHVNYLSRFECLGAIRTSKFQHLGITMNFDGLFILHTMSVSNKFFGESCAY